MASIGGAGTPTINSVFLKQQAADPSAPASGYAQLYDKSGGLYFEESGGNVAQFPKIAKVALVAGTDTGGGILSWANPESGSIIIDRVIIDLTTIASAACTADFGTTASTSTTSSDNFMDGLDLHSSTGQ